MSFLWFDTYWHRICIYSRHCYLSSIRSQKIILEFEDGTKIDLQKSLMTNTVTIEELREQGLKVIVKKISD